jgi:hypothetical protein
VSAAHSIGLALEGVGRINRVKNGTGKVDGNFRVAPVEAEGVGGGLGRSVGRERTEVSTDLESGVLEKQDGGAGVR